MGIVDELREANTGVLLAVAAGVVVVGFVLLVVATVVVAAVVGTFVLGVGEEATPDANFEAEGSDGVVVVTTPFHASVDDTGASAERHVRTIREARERGRERGSVGSHAVRNNVVSDCGQAGIVGSMGAAFSRVTGNHVHHING